MAKTGIWRRRNSQENNHEDLHIQPIHRNDENSLREKRTGKIQYRKHYKNIYAGKHNLVWRK